MRTSRLLSLKIFKMASLLSLLGLAEASPSWAASDCYCYDKSKTPNTCSYFPASARSTCALTGPSYCPNGTIVISAAQVLKNKTYKKYCNRKNAPELKMISAENSNNVEEKKVSSGNKTCFCQAQDGSCNKFFISATLDCRFQTDFSCVQSLSSDATCKNKGKVTDYALSTNSISAPTTNSLMVVTSEKAIKTEVETKLETAKQNKMNKSKLLTDQMVHRKTNEELASDESKGKKSKEAADPETGFKNARIKTNLEGKTYDELSAIKDRSGEVKKDKGTLLQQYSDGTIVNNDQHKSDYKDVLVNKQEMNEIKQKLQNKDLNQEEFKSLSQQYSDLNKKNEDIYKKRNITEDTSTEGFTISKEEQLKLQEETKLKTELREARKIERKSERAANKALEAQEMGGLLREENTTNSYCGAYNTKNCEATRLAQDSIRLTTQVSNQVATAVVQNQAGNRVANLQGQGNNATISSMNTAQGDTMKDAAKMNNYMGAVQDAAGAYQMFRGFQHLKSGKKVNNAGEAELKAIDSETAEYESIAKESESKINLTKAKISQNDARIKTLKSQLNLAPAEEKEPIQIEIQRLAEEGGNLESTLQQEENRYQSASNSLDKLNQQRGNVMKNSSAEASAQRVTAESAMVSAATTLQQGALNHMNANMLKKQAEALSVMSGTSNGELGNYALNPSLANNESVNYVTPESPSSAEAVSSDQPTEDNGDLGGFGDYNTNYGNDKVADGNPGDFISKPNSENSGVAGSGPGNAGGTSAAREGSGGPSDGGKTKLQAGGSFASAGSGAVFGRKGGSNGGISSESGFGDFLKSFLPGAKEEAKKKDSLSLDSDRLPASDRAAVIGRNQNIFVEISKRYKKKDSEGAVAFQ